MKPKLSMPGPTGLQAGDPPVGCCFKETAAIVNIKLKLHHYLSLPFQFEIMPETTMKVTKDTVKISGLGRGYTVQLKDADPNELQLFIAKMPPFTKGESVKYNFSKLCLVLVLE